MANIPNFSETVAAQQTDTRPNIQPAVQNFLAAQQITDARNHQSLADKLAMASANIEALQRDQTLRQQLAGLDETKRHNLAQETSGENKLSLLQQQLELAKLKADNAVNKADNKLTPGQEALDKEFAKTYAQFKLEGGQQQVEGNLNKLNEGITTLSALSQASPTEQKATRLGAALPDFARGIIQPKYKALEQDSRSNVVSLLRATLGAQFTEKEGERIFSQTFDPTLPPEINSQRLSRLRDSILAKYNALNSASQEFASKGTLKDYKAPLVNLGSSLADELISSAKATPSQPGQSGGFRIISSRPAGR